MRTLKLAVIMMLTVAVCVPAFAETQTVKVSGQLDAKYVYRGDFDLSENNDASVVPATLSPPAPATGKAIGEGSDSDSYFSSVMQLEVAADLTDNVGVVIRLVNQRDWNARAFQDNADGGVSRGDENTADEFGVIVDLAYAEMKEIFYQPLTLKIGRQDVWLGRGFVIGANLQEPTNTIQADDQTVITSFDAIRGTLDFAPWTIDAIYINADENELNAEDDNNLWIVNVNYQFDKYAAAAELYGMIQANRGAVSGVVTTGEVDNVTYTIGTRGQFNPIDNITLGGEYAYQFGDYAVAVDTLSRDISAYAIELFGEYRWLEYEWTPMIGVEYVHLSGEAVGDSTGDYEAWNCLYTGRTFGDIREYQSVFWSTAQNGDTNSLSNQNLISLYGDITPMEDLMLDAKFYWFWNDETLQAGGGDLSSDIGKELDIHVKYAYTEDVSFGLNLAWFFPGDQYNGYGQETGTTDTDAVATQVISNVSVLF